MTFARRVFRGAGIYGLLLVAPMFFLEPRMNADFPPPITHPEYYYGFVGTVVAFQVVFLVISSDPVRYRAFMIPSILEKAFYAVGVPILYLGHRTPGTVLFFSQIDLVLGILFAVSYLKTAGAEKKS